MYPLNIFDFVYIYIYIYILYKYIKIFQKSLTNALYCTWLMFGKVLMLKSMFLYKIQSLKRQQRKNMIALKYWETHNFDSRK